jgi:hypothetical protein
MPAPIGLGRRRSWTSWWKLAGWRRDYARAGLRGEVKLKVVKARAPRGPMYGPRIIAALITCWAVAAAGKRLVPMLEVLVPIGHRSAILCGHPLTGVGRFPNLAGGPAGTATCATLHCCRRA